MSKITLFASYIVIYRTSSIKAYGSAFFLGEFSSIKQFTLTMPVTDMRFCPKLPFCNAKNTQICPLELIATHSHEKKIEIHSKVLCTINLAII